jgi:hypothetical protein
MDSLPEGVKDGFSSLGQSFSLDILSWTRLCPDGLLGRVLASFVKRWKLNDKLDLSLAKIYRFAATIEMGHQSNPYHWYDHPSLPPCQLPSSTDCVCDLIESTIYPSHHPFSFQCNGVAC